MASGNKLSALRSSAAFMLACHTVGDRALVVGYAHGKAARLAGVKPRLKALPVVTDSLEDC